MASCNYTTILIDKQTREKLKNIGKKCQTYNQIINELIQKGGLKPSND